MTNSVMALAGIMHKGLANVADIRISSPEREEVMAVLGGNGIGRTSKSSNRVPVSTLVPPTDG